jgi:hypothetical protein
VTGANRGTASSAAAANGRLSRNAPRQLQVVTTTPPTIGPLAAPMPWISRAATRTLSVGASPQAADAAPKTSRPPVNTRCPPSRSASAPPVSRNAAKLSV